MKVVPPEDILVRQNDKAAVAAEGEGPEASWHIAPCRWTTVLCGQNIDGSGRRANVKHTAELGRQNSKVGVVENMVEGNGSNAARLGMERSDPLLLFNLAHLDRAEWLRTGKALEMDASGHFRGNEPVALNVH